ncbi:MAG: sugar kinase [Clostridiales bacterium]|nr:sugar kinase [Clostridiales bacterium]
MKKIATFGEIMLRLSPPAKERLFQSPSLTARFGGGEANVAVSLALFGHEVRHISVVPENELGDAACAELRRWKVDTMYILRQGRRLGIYFAETGANQRPSKVIYDRECSALAEARPGDINWGKALTGVDWFHVTGITPALSETSAKLTLEAARKAKDMGMTVSVDLNYRNKLWKYGKTAPEVMPAVFRLADVGMGNEEDYQKSLGIAAPVDVEKGQLDVAIYEKMTAAVCEAFPNLSLVAVTLRESRSVDHVRWSAVLRRGESFIIGTCHDIADIVDRIGAGDAFAAGLIHGLDIFADDERALNFAIASSCLKHSIPGDFNLVTEGDVLALMKGEKSGRIQR